jgi:hypothetical protein
VPVPPAEVRALRFSPSLPVLIFRFWLSSRGSEATKDLLWSLPLFFRAPHPCGFCKGWVCKHPQPPRRSERSARISHQPLAIQHSPLISSLSLSSRQSEATSNGSPTFVVRAMKSLLAPFPAIARRKTTPLSGRASSPDRKPARSAYLSRCLSREPFRRAFQRISTPQRNGQPADRSDRGVLSLPQTAIE